MMLEVVMAGDESGCSQLVAVVQAAQFHCRHPGPHHTTIAMQSSVLLLDGSTQCICNISMQISQLYNLCHTGSVDFRNL